MGVVWNKIVAAWATELSDAARHGENSGCGQRPFCGLGDGKSGLGAELRVQSGVVCGFKGAANAVLSVLT